MCVNLKFYLVTIAAIIVLDMADVRLKMTKCIKFMKF